MAVHSENHDADADDDEEYDDEDEGAEFCPICERLNKPGEDDTCDHYVGMEWEGDICCAWGDDWHKAVTEAAEAYDAWLTSKKPDESEERRVSDEIRKILGSEPCADAITCGESPQQAMMESVDFSYGHTIVTEGMVGGCGNSLYLANFNVVEEKIRSARKVAEMLKNLR